MTRGPRAPAYGGGVSNDGYRGTPADTLALSNVSINYNTATYSATYGGGADGGIYNSGHGGTATATLYDTSVRYNTATADGGGIYNNAAGIIDPATVTLTNADVTSNTARRNGGGSFNTPDGGTATYARTRGDVYNDTANGSPNNIVG